MNCGKIEKLYDYIISADCIFLDCSGQNTVSVDHAEIKNIPDNQVIYFKWTDDDFYDFSLILTEEGLSNARIEKNEIIVDDHEGEVVKIALYKLEKIKIKMKI